MVLWWPTTVNGQSICNIWFWCSDNWLLYRLGALLTSGLISMMIGGRLWFSCLQWTCYWVGKWSSTGSPFTAFNLMSGRLPIGDPWYQHGLQGTIDSGLISMMIGGRLWFSCLQLTCYWVGKWSSTGSSFIIRRSTLIRKPQSPTIWCSWKRDSTS